MFDFSDKVVLITGGASGIGARCGRRFVDAGAKVVLSDRDEAQGRALADVLERVSPGNRLGRPDEVADVILLLASPAASFVNGVELPIDGGTTGS